MRQKDNRVLLHIVEMAQEGVHLPKVALDSPKKKKKKELCMKLYNLIEVDSETFLETQYSALGYRH